MIMCVAGLLAMTLSPLVSSVVWQYAGPRAMYAIAFIVLSSGLVCLLVLFKRMVPWTEEISKKLSVAADEHDGDNDDDDGAASEDVVKRGWFSQKGEKRPLIAKSDYAATETGIGTSTVRSNSREKLF